MESVIKNPEVRIRPFSNVYIGTGNGLIKKRLKEGLDAIGGLQKFIRPGQSVFIKPNLTATQDEMTGGVTDIRSCAALIELIQEECQPGHMMVGENTLQGGVIAVYFETHGWVDMCKKYGVELVDFDKDEWERYPVPDGMWFESVCLPKKFVEADCLISLSVLKNHDTVMVTGGIKNSFGCISANERREAHRQFAIEQSIVDVARVRKPDISILDGRIGMEGIAGGSHFNHPRYANRIIIGDDPVATDAVASHVMEQNPRVRYLQWCDEYGIGNANLDYINFPGMSIEEAKVKFMSPGEEVEESTDGRIHVLDTGACSRCITPVMSALHRFFLPENVAVTADILMGPNEVNFDEKGRNEKLVCIGDCVLQKYRDAGYCVKGCPVTQEDFFEIMNQENILCHACETAVLEWIDSKKPEDIDFLRILASNRTVYKGKNNHAEATDYVLGVGNCQAEYIHYHKERSKQEFADIGVTTDINDIVGFVPGHHVTVEQIEAEYQRLKAHHDANA